MKQAYRPNQLFILQSPANTTVFLNGCRLLSQLVIPFVLFITHTHAKLRLACVYSPRRQHIIIIIIIIIPGQCLWCCHHAVAALREFTLVHVSAARRQVAADLWTKPIGLNHKPACRLPVNYTLTIAILLLLSPKADTHFTIPRRVEG